MHTIKGRLEDLDPSKSTFDINGLTIDFSAASPTMPSLNEEQMVTVLGVMNDDEIFEATDIKAWNPIGRALDVTREAWVSGLVNHFETPTSFWIDFYPVITDDQTVFINAEPSALDGASVVATGTLRNGILQADTIEARHSTDLKVRKGNILSIDSEEKTFKMLLVKGGAVVSKVRVTANTTIRYHREKQAFPFEELTHDADIKLVGWILPDDSVDAFYIDIR